MYCGQETRVINSRHQKRRNHVWRRRQCIACNAVFTTEEAPDLAGSVRVTNPLTASSTDFNRDKLFLSLYRALGHRKDAVEASSALCATIIVKLHQESPGAIVTTTVIRQVTYATLAHFDAAASIAYAAYHTEIKA